MLLNGNALHIPLADKSVHCCISSPPYWGLRDYGLATWEGGDPGCDHRKRESSRDPSSTLKGPTNREGYANDTYSGICLKCSAISHDAGIGLEPTPEEYTANMVQVFREVWRVLRDDGTCWVNLGDSYNANTGSGFNGQKRYDHANRNTKMRLALPPKNLVGIPWRVAFALQQPFYSGRIQNESDRIWLAAMIDTEGCMFIHKRKVGQYASEYKGKRYHRKTASYGAGLEIANTHLAIIERCMSITGMGSISTQGPEQNPRRKQTIYRWSLRSNVCREVIREVYPYLVAKKHQARILYGCPSSGDKASAAHGALKGLHNGSTTDIDFPDPETLYSPGWYLRSEIIWSKLNPMPESVTDRPTKAHETVFLLSKRARYFYDSDAIRERLAPDTMPRLMRGSGADHKNVNGAPGQTPHSINQPREYGQGYSGINPAGRNRRTVWTIATAPYSGAHFATFPPKLIEPMVKAGTSERGVCPECGKQWERVVDISHYSSTYGDSVRPDVPGSNDQKRNQDQYGTRGFDERKRKVVKTLGFTPTCSHEHDPIPATVLDPFVGSGTTVQVARSLGRRGIGIDLSPKYLQLARQRLELDKLDDWGRGIKDAAVYDNLPLFRGEG